MLQSRHRAAWLRRRRAAWLGRAALSAGIRAAAEANARLRTVLAHAPIVLFTLDHRGVFTLQEGRGLEAARLRQHGEIGQSIFRVYQDHPWVTESARRALAGESVRVVGEFQGAWFEVYFMPLRIPGNKGAGVLGVATDITARKRALDALEQQKAVLQYVIANVPHAIFWKDRQSRFLGGNQNFLNDTGTKTLENLVGKTDYDIWSRREDADGFVKIDREVMESGTPILNLEEPLLRQDGAQRVLLTSKVPIRDERGEVTGLLGIYADITERKQMEIDLQNAKEAADDAARAKGQFLTVMSHELRTPLALILGPLASLLSDESSEREPPPPSIRADLERIQRSARRLHRLVDDILEHQKIEAGKQELDWEVVDAGELCADIVDAARPAAAPGGITLSLEADSGMEPVPLDRRKFEKIVLNLLGNALKFTPQGGRIVVRLRRIGAELEFSVEDTGPGIPADKQHLLFKRFQQIDASATRKHEGTGIGLSLVKELAELMGGKACVESTVGVGSRFFVRLPCVADRIVAPRPSQGMIGATNHAQGAGYFEAPAPRARHAGTSGRGSRVLVAEDNPDMGAYLVDILSAEHEVELMTNGRAALEAALARRPEVIVSDVMMPEMDGFELVRRLKGDPASRDIPILLLTARAGRVAAVGGLDMGADDYLSKPFDPAELLARVRAAERLHRMHVELGEKNRELAGALQRLTATQEELVQAGKMAAVGTMLAGLSHEMNNPLAIILMNAQLSLRRLGATKEPGDEAALRKRLHTIEAQATRCSGLVHTLLEYSRGKPTGHEPCDVRAALDRVLEFTTAQASAREVRLDVWQDPEAPSAVLANVAQLDAALLNVVGNALDAVLGGGTVSVVARPVDKIDVGKDAIPGVEFEVCDTGCGISAENLDHIFEPFFTTKPPGQGTGLGLTLTQRFVMDHGGRIHVTSKTGAGTTVRMWLPAAPSP